MLQGGAQVLGDHHEQECAWPSSCGSEVALKPDIALQEHHSRRRRDKKDAEDIAEHHDGLHQGPRDSLHERPRRREGAEAAL